MSSNCARVIQHEVSNSPVENKRHDLKGVVGVETFLGREPKRSVEELTLLGLECFEELGPARVVALSLLDITIQKVFTLIDGRTR